MCFDEQSTCHFDGSQLLRGEIKFGSRIKDA